MEIHSYHVWTVGCQMNKADSERLESALDGIGLRSSDSAQDADVVVLNSCVVRQSAEDRVVGMLGSLRHAHREAPDKIVALMGCMVGAQDGDVGEPLPPR